MRKSYDSNIHVGLRWHREIEKQLQAAKAVVVLWSSTSRDSDHVLEEAEYGKRKDILFPALIEKVEIPYGFGRIQCADLVGWVNDKNHAGLDKLLTILQQHLNHTLHTPGQTFRDKLKSGGEGPLMVTLPPERFLMGSPKNEAGLGDNEGRPQHEVHIAEPFAMGVYTVTFDDYDLFCQSTDRKKTDDRGWGRKSRPVINVSWHDAQDYCIWLSEQTGQNYRLPSETEWECACRARTVGSYNTGEGLTVEQANFDGSLDKTAPVGSYPPNAFGLYDMHGNVWEWCEDTWHDNYDDAPTDGAAWIDKGGSRYRVLRGGSWFNDGRHCRSASRHRYVPDLAYHYIGFRLARGH